MNGLLRKRSPRGNFSTINYLGQNSLQPPTQQKNFKIHNQRGYQGLHLNEVVRLVQQEIKDIPDEDSNKLLYLSAIGDPVAQEKMKSIINRIMDDKRLYITDGLPDDMDPNETVFALTSGADWIEDLYKLNDVEEVQVIGNKIYVMRDGITTFHPTRKFSSFEDVENLQERLTLFGNKNISKQNPFVQTRMFTKSRLVMMRPPYSSQPLIFIRNFLMKSPSLESMVQRQTIDERVAELLRLLVIYHASIIVAGGMATGKTTFLFALAKELFGKERIRCLEMDFELLLEERLEYERNIASFQSLPELGYDMEESFKPMLLTSAERMIIGEMRGKEAAQAIQAALRGHDFLGTLHSKYEDMVIYDLMDMVQQDGRSHNEKYLLNRIARAFNIVVFLGLAKESEYKARRVVTKVCQIYIKSDGTLAVEPLIVWNQEKDIWELTGHKLDRRLMEHMRFYGAKESQFRNLGVWE